jgi:hypothetical protein
MSVKVIKGLSAEESPFPLPEMAHGNIVRLKEAMRDPRTGQAGRWGVIAGHYSRNAFGTPIVQLVLYDDENRLLSEANHIPVYFDIPASRFLLWHLSGGIGYDPVVPGGFDLYPPCPTCDGTGNKPDESDVCPVCSGSGHEPEMRRLPESAIPKPPPDLDIGSIVEGM